MPGFNLVDDGWIPCAGLRTDRWEELGLRDALVKAHLVREVVSPSPLASVAIHRLMLAVLHRVFGPSSASRWAELWAAGAWDSAALDAYFDRWRGRFDLFDPVHPFYQTAGLSFE